MTHVEPLVRARYMKLMVDALEGAPPGRRAMVKAVLRPDVVPQIRSAGALAWLPAELNLHVTAAVSRCFGAADSQTFFRHLLSSVYSSALMATFIGGMSRLFGKDPASYAKVIPRGYGVIFRGVGRWVVLSREADLVELGLVDLPERFANDKWWPLSVASALHSVLDLAGQAGSVELVGGDRDSLVFAMSWAAEQVPNLPAGGHQIRSREANR